ncbi:MAG TPA: hypothetical protein VH000_05525 [Rhizomicrobium sp.]|jgi:hypothetical protein|nr:hypothetical protein [Rhizomicrobium sp.]
MSFKRFARNLALSALCAVATPVLAAGLVEGTSAAVRSVADAATPQKADAAATPDIAAPSKVHSQRTATAPPARLGAPIEDHPAVLAGAGDGAGAQPH